MATWSEKRKFIYATAVILVIGIVFGIPVFLLFYQAPTCFDGKKNGGEQGVDCGGWCTRLCQSDFLAPSVTWTKIEEVVPGTYNAAAYVVNPNVAGEAKNVPYHMAIYDNGGMLIVDKKGTVDIPPHRNTLAFSGLIKVGNSIPSKVLFEFTDRPDWYKKEDRLSLLEVSNKEYSEDNEGSSLRVTLNNNDVNPVGKLDVYVVLYDKDGNTIGFSKTIIDDILPHSTVVAPFTWNTNRKGAVVSIEVLYVAE